MEPPRALEYTFIHAPNLAILVVKTLFLTRQLGALFLHEQKDLLESHQVEKQSIAGTARRMAEHLGIKVEEIQSIRDRQTQIHELCITNPEPIDKVWNL